MPKPSPEALEPNNYAHHLKIPTRFTDLNVGNHVSNISIIQIFEDARARFCLENGIEIVNPEFVLMVVSNKIDYMAECFWPAPLFIHSKIGKIGNASFEISQLAIQDNKPVAICTLTIVHTKSGKACAISEDLKTKITNIKQA